MSWLRFWSWLIPLFTWLTAQGATGGKPPAIWDLFQPPSLLEAALAPDGQHLALIRAVRVPGTNQLGLGGQLGFLNLEQNRLRWLPYENNRSYSWMAWANDSTLVFGILHHQFGKDHDSGGIFALGAEEDFSKIRVVVPNFQKQVNEVASIRISSLLGRIPGSPDELLLRSDRVFDGDRGSGVYRVNHVTGKRTLVAKNPGEVDAWMADGQGEVRIGLKLAVKRASIIHRWPGQDDWEELTGSQDFAELTFWPEGFTQDGKTLIVGRDVDGRGDSLYNYDLSKRELGQLLFSVPGHDVMGITENGVLVGAEYLDGRPRFHYFDPAWAAAQEKLDRLMPERVNEIREISADRRRVLVRSSADRSPPRWFLFQPDARKLSPLNEPPEWVQEDRLGVMEPIEYAAPDGLVIHGYLTRPPGTVRTNLPLVVMPHGGPWAHDQWGWDPDAQFLATRGYAVLQPNFRGSTGYGTRFLDAGDQQWGRKMQDDITAGVKWAVAQGIADPKRVAIYGASYGGYAALMGLIETPELYRCGISYCGVTDLRDILKENAQDNGQSARHQRRRIGQRWSDREELRANSPLNLVERIQAPLLFAYGGEDDRIDADSGRRFVSALKKHDKDHQVIFKKDEGHGFRRRPAIEEFYTAMEQLLARQIGPGVTAN